MNVVAGQMSAGLCRKRRQGYAEVHGMGPKSTRHMRCVAPLPHRMRSGGSSPLVAAVWLGG